MEIKVIFGENVSLCGRRTWISKFLAWTQNISM